MTRNLVLIHGWGFDSRIWKTLTPQLESFSQVITVDIPGLGVGQTGLDDIEVVAEKIIAQLPEKSVLLGWSLGGMIATYIATQYPARVDGLITVGSTLKWVEDKPWPGTRKDNFSAFADMLVTDLKNTLRQFCVQVCRGSPQERQRVRQLGSLLSDSPVSSLAKGLKLLNVIDNRQAYSQLSMPGVHIFGEKDCMVPTTVADAMEALNPRQQSCVIGSASHVVFFDQPERFLKIVKGFIGGLDYRLEKKQIARSFSRAASTYDDAALLQRRIGDQLLSLMDADDVNVALDLGCGTGYGSQQLAERYQHADIVSLDLAEGMLHAAVDKQNCRRVVCGDAEKLPLADKSIDLVFANLSVQWCQDLQTLFSEICRVLSNQGQACISTFVEGTLCELDQAWMQVDDAAHVNQFVSVERLENIVDALDFADIQLQKQTIEISYDNIRQLMHELKAIGAHNVNSGRSHGLSGKGKLKQLELAYEKYRQGNKIPATYETVFILLSKRG